MNFIKRDEFLPQVVVLQDGGRLSEHKEPLEKDLIGWRCGCVERGCGRVWERKDTS